MEEGKKKVHTQAQKDIYPEQKSDLKALPQTVPKAQSPTNQ